MFQLQDGRTELFQWDINRKVFVSDPTVSEVHFCNKTDECSLVVKVKDSLADIPNILLQTDFPIRVYAYCGEGYTKVEKVFKVHSRTKPSDYVYTETEVKNYDELEKRIDEIESKGVSQETIDKAVQDYLKEHPIEAGATTEQVAQINKNTEDILNLDKEIDTLPTKDYVDNAVENVSVDLTGYATEEYVTKKIAEAEIGGNGEVDLTGYATENWVKTQGYLTSIPSEYVTELELTAKGYATNSALNNYAKKTEIPTVPTKVSELVNDKGYLTEHIDISGKSDKGHQHTLAQITDYVEPVIPTKVGELTNDKNYTTQTYVDNAIYNSKDSYYIRLFNIPTGEENAVTASDELVEFATRFVNDRNVCLHFQETDGTTNTGYKSANITYISNRITFKDATIDIIRIANNSYTSYYSYVLKLNGTEWVIFKTLIGGFTITTKEYVDSAIAGIEIPESSGGDVDLTDYYTKEETEALIPTKVSAFTNDAGYLTEHQDISGKADKGHTHKMSDITDYVAPTIPSLDGYATEKYVDDAIANIDIPEGGGGTADLTGYATEEWVTEQGYATKSYVDTVAGSASGGGIPHYTIGYPTVDATHRAILNSIASGDIVVNQHCTVAIVSDNLALPVTSCTYGGTGYSSNITFFCTNSNARHTYLYKKTNYVDGVGYTWVGTATNREGFTTVDTVNTLINDALGVIENGTY